MEDRLGPERLSVGWPWRLSLFSLLVLITSVVLYAGLEFGYKIFLNSQIKKQDERIAKLTQAVSAEDQKAFVDFYSQLANLQYLLDNHIITSKIFSFLETNTNKLVYYTFVDLRVKDRKLSLEGIARSYEIFAQQLEAFNRASEVEQLLINESQLADGQVRFRLFVVLRPELFK